MQLDFFSFSVDRGSGIEDSLRHFIGDAAGTGIFQNLYALFQIAGLDVGLSEIHPYAVNGIQDQDDDNDGEEGFYFHRSATTARTIVRIAIKIR